MFLEIFVSFVFVTHYIFFHYIEHGIAPIIPPIGLSPRSVTKPKQPETPETYTSSVTMKSNGSAVSMSPTAMLSTPPAKRNLENYDDIETNDQTKKNHKLSYLDVPWTDYDALACYLTKVHPVDSALLSEISHIELIEYACADYTPSELKCLLVYFGTNYGVPLQNLKTDGSQTKKNITIQLRDLLMAHNKNTGDTKE